MARRPTTVDESARSALDCGGSTPPSLGQLAGRRTTTALLSRAGSPCHVAWPSWPYADWPNSRGQLAGRGSLFIRLKVKNGAASKLAGSKRRQSLPLSEAKGRRTPRRLRRTLFTDHFHDGEGAQGKLSEESRSETALSKITTTRVIPANAEIHALETDLDPPACARVTHTVIFIPLGGPTDRIKLSNNPEFERRRVRKVRKAMMHARRCAEK
jgi:hypothetical protein